MTEMDAEYNRIVARDREAALRATIAELTQKAKEIEAQLKQVRAFMRSAIERGFSGEDIPQALADFDRCVAALTAEEPKAHPLEVHSGPYSHREAQDGPTS